MLSLKGISVAFGENAVLSGVTRDFDAGVTAVTGASGSGKTTLFNVILGLITPDSGSVVYPENAVLSAVFQEDRLLEQMNAAKNISLTCPNATDVEIASALKTLGLPENDRKRVVKYSGGMKRRVAIIRAVLRKPSILILDEPFTGLDEDAKEIAARFILENCGGAIILLSTHDAREAALMGAKDTLFF